MFVTQNLPFPNIELSLETQKHIFKSSSGLTSDWFLTIGFVNNNGS